MPNLNHYQTEFLKRLRREGHQPVNTLDPFLAWSLTERGYCRIKMMPCEGPLPGELPVLELTDAGRLTLELMEKCHDTTH